MIRLQFWEGPPWEASGSSSVPPPMATGSGEFTPPQPRGPVAGPSSVSPSIAPAAGPASVSPPLTAGSVPEDAVSLQEGGCSFYESTLQEVWINGAIINSHVVWTRRGLD
ncbi:hypothetical protein Taro_002283 [Colocasia esculenta]|uniref:Uncharacterized protein n=1 Tax=Colocasia esculenta TaxID=4460 RepID=A0A843TKA5_COLES|nr:hypothetical protein [Colocasia esculenta]